MGKAFVLSLILATTSGYAANQLELQQKSLHLDWLDTQTAPQKNFYQYANGAWKAAHPVPNDYATWGSFSVLNEKNQKAIQTMLEELEHNQQIKAGSLEQKIRDFYFSGMNVASIDQQGAEPLQGEFQRVAAIHSLSGLVKEIIHMHHYGINAVFGYGSMQDFKDSTQMIGAVMQGGLSLPDRDYYLKKEQKFVTIRTAFLAHMTKMFELAGDTPTQAAEQAKTVMRIETELAKGSMTQIAQREPEAVYHLMSVQALEKLTPHFDWVQYFKQNDQNLETKVNVGMPNFLRTFDRMLTTVSLADWKVYLRWGWLDSMSSYLSQSFIQENFNMAHVLSGIQSLPPRWKQVVGTESGALGFGIGEIYVRQHFSAAARQQVIDMIAQIRKVLRHDLANLQWMSKQTRQAAIKKLDMIEERVGYPDKWWDYSSLKIDRGPYVWNILRASAFLVKRDLNKIGKPVDRSEWAMTPQVVNAYYDPSMNNINIPMGILQSPYFDPNAPLAANYGGIGVVIGHEITHGFDDQGAKFDGYGNLHNWWTATDLTKFKSATQCIIDQYSQYKITGDVPVQGSLVVGEATADLGGLILAYRAFHAADGYQTQPTIQGFTPDQQFFLSFAHIWANNIRKEHEYNLNIVDPHPPAMYRVNGTLANSSEFKRDFGITDPSPMSNPKPCVIW